jgi:hypothetical protein
MDHSKIASQSQADIQVQSKIGDFFNRFHIGSLMHRCGIRKHHGHGVRSLTEAIFTLPFVVSSLMMICLLVKTPLTSCSRDRPLTGAVYFFAWEGGWFPSSTV